MAMSMSEMMSAMKTKTGEEFDQLFIEAMIMHHEQAIEMTNDARDRASNPRLKEMAEEMNKKQQQEINEMKVIRKQT